MRADGWNMESTKKNVSRVNEPPSRLENFEEYDEIWGLVKATVKNSLNERRVGMMLFLDDLPIRIGTYHPWEPITLS